MDAGSVHSFVQIIDWLWNMLNRLEINVNTFREKIPQDMDFFKMMERIGSDEWYLIFAKECEEKGD